MIADGEDHDLEQLMASACSLVAGGEDIGSIAVVATRRLTYHELARLRDHAADCSVAITMDADGTVLVRRHDAETRSRQSERFGGEKGHGSGDSGRHGVR